MFSLLGMNIFPYVKSKGGLDSYYNFHTFYSSCVTLLWSCTGEAWNRSFLKK